MPKTVDDIAKALKLKAEPKQNALTLKLGVKKLTLPFEARCLSSANYVFVHIPPSAGIMKITDSGLAPVNDVAEAQAAVASFRQSRKRTGSTRKADKVAMPSQLEDALNLIPSGYKLAYGQDGKARLVKARNRGKK